MCCQEKLCIYYYHCETQLVTQKTLKLHKIILRISKTFRTKQHEEVIGLQNNFGIQTSLEDLVFAEID